jgi:hypothetical protein
MDIDLKPTEAMAHNAARGLELREKHGRGGTEVGVARARDIKNRKNLSPDTVRRMHSFFARHEVDKTGKGWKAGSEGYPSAGHVAWLLWGGDSGKAWADSKVNALDRKEKTMNERPSTPSHEVIENGDKAIVRRVELFMAFDPSIDDGENDPELKRFNNERLKKIVSTTRAHMARGSFPQVVILHEKQGDEPKSAVGRIPAINYEERNGIGYIVGDMEINKPIFDKLIATNAFPRRSAEIWSESNHLSEIALLGRETPRRPLPDTHFERQGKKITCSKSNFDMVGAGGGLNTYVPTTTKENAEMATHDEISKHMEAAKRSFEAMCEAIKTKFESHDATTKGYEDWKGKYESEDEAEDAHEAKEHKKDNPFEAEYESEEADAKKRVKKPMSAEAKRKMAEDTVHIDVGSHQGAPDMEEEVLASRKSAYSLRSENARLKDRMSRLEAEIKREKFSRDLDSMAQDGYRIPEGQRDNLLMTLMHSQDPVALIESWRDLFARDPIGTKIDMSRAALPKSITPDDIGALVKQFAGKPEEFAKAINSRIKK